MLKNYYLIMTINFGDRFLKFHFSKTKRGLNTREMVEDNYQDMQLKRYEEGYEERTLISINFETPSNIKDLRYSIDFNYINFKNAGFKFSDNKGVWCNIENIY